LDRQCALIDPLIIVTLGRFSMARYFPGGKITQLHGKPKYDERRAYYPLFHPAAVLRNPGLQGEMETAFRRIPEIIAAVRAKRAQASQPPADDPPPTQLKLF
jgi:DNA polymerase